MPGLIVTFVMTDIARATCRAGTAAPYGGLFRLGLNDFLAYGADGPRVVGAVAFSGSAPGLAAVSLAAVSLVG